MRITIGGVLFSGMKIAFIYFPDFTLLDVVGVYDPLQRLRTLGIIPSLTIEHRAFHPAESIQDAMGWSPPATHFSTGETSTEPINGYDMLFVPGGMGTRPLQTDSAFLAWLRTARDTPLLTSVCTGSLLLGAAGLLDGHRATTHFREYDSLRAFLPEVETANLVDDGRVITAGAVAASLTLGLYLCKKLGGAEAEAAVRKSMNYYGE